MTLAAHRRPKADTKRSTVAAAALASALAALAAVAPAFAAPSDDLTTLANDYRAFQLANDPITAGQEGDAEAARRLPDARLETDQSRAVAIDALIARAEALAPEGLSPTEVATRGLLLHELSNAATSLEFDEARIPVTNDSGYHTILDYLSRQTPIRSVEDAEALIARYGDYARYTDENLANARRGIETGWTQPAVVIDRVIAILEAQTVGEPSAHAFYEPFKALPETIPPAERERLQTEAQAALREAVGPAAARSLAFFQTEYRAAARPALGVSSLPDGAAWYARLTKSYTTLDRTPDEIHALGLAEVARIRAGMEAIIAEVGFEGTFAEFLQFLRTDPQFYAETPDALLKEAAWIAKRTDGVMPKFFGTLPRLSYGVIPVPEAIAPAYTTGRYWPGDYENGVAGNYVVNTYDLKARPLYELSSLSLHEGVPGHHHQIALAQELDNLPAFRKDVYVTAFGEGWGLYAEHLGHEMGLYRTPYERFGALSYEMWRACRLVVDTGLHAKGWTRDQAEACFKENSALSLGNITTEVDRYISWPGQALAYKMGELKIKELRAKAEAELGVKFDVRRFHDAVLEDGAVTLSMLEDKIERWIAEETAGAAE